MTDKEIQAELNKDSQKFYNVKFEGELPKDIIHLFGLAIFYIAPSVHQIQAVKIKEILSKTKEELLVGEVGMVVNVILNAAPFYLYEDIHKFLETQESFEKLFIQYNKDVTDFTQRQERKRRSLIELGGSKTRPMQIIRKN